MCANCESVALQSAALQSGNRLLRKPDVAARVEELKKAVSHRQVEKFAVNRVWLLSMLTENANRAIQVEPVRDHEGNPIGQYAYQGAVANKALELIGKETVSAGIKYPQFCRFCRSSTWAGTR